MSSDFMLWRIPIDRPYEEARASLDDVPTWKLARILGDAENYGDDWFSDFVAELDGMQWQQIHGDGFVRTEFVADSFPAMVGQIRAAIRARANAALDAVYLIERNRDIVHRKFDGRTWAVTGGLSTGDKPTDGCDDLELFSELEGITYTHWEAPLVAMLDRDTLKAQITMLRQVAESSGLEPDEADAVDAVIALLRQLRTVAR